MSTRWTRFEDLTFRLLGVFAIGLLWLLMAGITVGAVCAIGYFFEWLGAL
jgi:hypothetical protein